MARSVRGVAPYGDTSLASTLYFTASVPNWNVAFYWARYGRLLDALRYAGMFLDDRSKTISDHRGMLFYKNIGAWNRRSPLVGQDHAGTISSDDQLDMPFICYGVDAGYLRRLYTLFQKYRERSTEKEGYAWMSLFSFKPLHDKLSLVRGAAIWWSEHRF